MGVRHRSDIDAPLRAADRMSWATAGSFSYVIGRIPIVDVQPVVAGGQRPAQAVPGESFEVSATVFREGHEMLGAGVVLRGPDGRRHPLVPMRELAPGTDRYGAEVTVTSEGLWQFEVEAWGDPIARWRHDAAIKVPLGQDVELTLGDGALLFERAAAGTRAPRSAGAAETRAAAAARAALEALAETLRDPRIPALDRLAAAGRDEITAILRRLPAARPAQPVGPAPGARAPAARALRLLVRVLPPVRGRRRGPGPGLRPEVGDAADRRGPAGRDRGRWASTSSTSRRSTRSGSPPGRAPTTR